MKAAFDLMDTNHDGKLGKEEIKATVKSLDGDFPEDKYDEFIEICNPGGKDITLQQLIEKGPDSLMKVLFFVIFDKNHDKHIDYSEFKSMTDIAAGGIPNESQLKEIFAKLDKNNDGMISLNELLDVND
jgi:Ca2+-binding EF-hand superfamily protein